ncbi:uncharacterized protein LOC105212046 isoform X2 [Zeugodacus cucurbitae]|uniref:uncharacterized protein LOC105212046 isoform X2 n=1 Tax=Zeugodacus cucurbitae TaxID=28588 RepID=UPI0023D90107|nr:uncharacterized protein LOC105212046 isoform X2 [Zeugodacus cucurbitae]
MANVLTCLFGVLLMTAVVSVTAENGITIFIDGGKEFDSMKADVQAIRSAENKLNRELKKIEGSIEQLTKLMADLSKNVESIKVNRKCQISVSKGNDRNNKLK